MEAHMAVTTTLSSREFNQDTGRAKKAAKRGPVIITDRDKPTHVLLSIEEYRKLTRKKGTRQSIADLIAMPEAAEIEFEPPRMMTSFPRPAEFE
jgi:prevent-host-death family protein